MPSQIRSHVLCVDDDEDAREMLTVLMNADGIDVTCAKSAAEAWSLIKARPFDLYLLDGWLPGIDGFEFCRQLRKANSNTPILFYSGAAYETDKQKGIAAGASAYVVKPDVDGLMKTIGQLIANAPEKNGAGWRVDTARDPAKESYPLQVIRFEPVCDLRNDPALT